MLPRPVADALAAAAARGAHVRVRLEAAPLGAADSDLARANRHCVTQLRAQGVDASLADGRDGVVHAKVALMDGVAWLDDRNFPSRGPDLIVRDDDPDDAAAIADALAGLPAHDGRVTLDKSASLELEARALTGGTPPALDVSTESFGDGPIERVLRDAIARGAHVRLILAARELCQGKPQELLALAHVAGAEIRVREDVDKLAVTPTYAWTGSANATASPDWNPQREWGRHDG